MTDLSDQLLAPACSATIERRVINSGRIVVSADGKSRTVTISGIDANGHKFSSNEVYESSDDRQVCANADKP